MKKKLLLAIMALALLSQLAFASTTSRNFTNAAGSMVRYIYTDLDINSTLTANSVYCVGQQISPASITSKWYYSSYITALANQVTQNSCMIPFTTVNTNQNPVWITPDQYTNMTTSNPYFPSLSSYTNHLSLIGVSTALSEEKSRYMNSIGGIWEINGNTYFKASAQTYCKGTASLVSSNPAYSQTVSPYLGQSNPFAPITLSQAGTFTLTSQVSLDACLAGGATFVNSPCTAAAYFYKDLSSPSMQFASTQKTITVKNPFSCNLVTFTAPTLSPSGAVAPGTQLSFSIPVTNSAANGEDARVTSVTTSGWSPPPSPVPQPYNTNVPLLVPKNGASYTITGKLDAPSVPGTYNFNLVVNYQSNVADCAGSVVNCPPKTYPLTIIVSQSTAPVSCTLAAPGHPSSTYIPADASDIVATCYSASGAVTGCDFIQWTTNVAGGSLNPSSSGAPPFQTHFSINAVSAPQANAFVKASHYTTFNCSYLLSITGPDYQPILSANATQVQVGKSFLANVTTKNIGGAANLSTFTALRFHTSAANFTVAPLAKQGTQDNNYVFFCSQAGTYQLNATADDTGLLIEGNEGNNFASIAINCTTAPPILKPDYNSTISAPPSVIVGGTFTISTVTGNIGPAPATAYSTTQLNITGYAPINFNIPPLAAGGYSNNGTTATCPGTPTTLTLTSFADIYNQTNESNRSNNFDTHTVNCVPLPNRPNYVPRIAVPPVVFLNLPFTASFITKNIGNASATANSVTRASFQNAISNFPVGALPINGEQTNNATYTCTGMPAVFNETVDVYNDINESDENNTEIKPIFCYQIPTSCTLEFVDHNSTFHTGESAPVRANCSAGGLQTACPPFFWQQSSTYGSMNPTNTNASWMPNSTLSITGTVTTQLNQKVNATSTLAGTTQGQIYCEIGFNVSDYSPIGPDYTIMSVTPDPSTAELYEQVDFTVVVKNIGNVDAVNDSTSVAAFSSGCTPVGATWYGLPALIVNQTDTNNDLSCKCTEIGTQSITVTANPAPHAQWETNYNNNAFTQTFICQGPALPITCNYFV